ncbi:expressed hypothetical protein [Trichoplax adhaerens]|uniref:Temptin Cys/Cys disulfide domain-containing protein n=1 Tax=Trichoplax adhaerens TaxID=10228 RepID=B3SBA7_TRIAD|nr:expressed hypothetical protein [Trichoplax adhaerens]EDV19969.1 expressed hypothetical protein [Trichoplax adhaerens]|eukprot:XP_002117559.1 expressed hypothetical protein [Trichoplax adhaerens]
MAKYAYLLVTIVFFTTITDIYGYLPYQTKIPNGARVPNPCSSSNAIWAGVGHQAAAGGGARNPFGVAFANANRTWTMALCQADSDGDGKTNGAELGDPDCIWLEGSAPNMTTGLSHPGICEPMNSATCCGKQSWLSCGVACPTGTTTNGAPRTLTYNVLFVLVTLIICALQ